VTRTRGSCRPSSLFLHGRLWDGPSRGPAAPFSVTKWLRPIDELNDEFPIRLTTGRRLDSYNTGLRPDREITDGSRLGIGVGTLLARPNFARDVICLPLADLPGRGIVVLAGVSCGVIGRVHGPFHRSSEC
jgi:hypothetical protein